MDGFLNTSASFSSDLTLVLTWVFALAAGYGGFQARRKNFDRHHSIMIAAGLLNWVPILIVMVPSWLSTLSGTQDLAAQPEALTPVAHGILGGITQLLITYTIVRMAWLKRLPPQRPLWLMRITIGLWLLTAIGGTFVYYALYIS